MQTTKGLEHYFTSTAAPVFALRNLSEEVKGALFARYSRSAKSLRELFADEFAAGAPPAAAGTGDGVGSERAKRLYRRVLAEYGDDSVAQLGSAHVAFEGVSNVATKILERGRLMSYLEQSTRYVPYTDRPGGRWKYVTPGDIESPGVRAAYQAAMDGLFETYARLLPRAEEHFRRVRPRADGEDEGAYRRAVRAKALDTVRGLLPAATRSNVGVHGSGQAFEGLLLRLLAGEVAECRELASGLRAALDQVIPEFVSRLDRDDRQERWVEHLRRRRLGAEETARALDGGHLEDAGPEQANQVRLLEHEADGEAKVIAAGAAPYSERTMDSLVDQALRMAPVETEATLQDLAGTRTNRRHRAGRAFEHTSYLFEVTSDYGAFRDLQRHRMLTMDWERLGVRRGLETPAAIGEMGAGAEWERAMDRAALAHWDVQRDCGSAAAQYAVPMAFRIRFTMRMNAREAMHMLELRTQPAGHAAYRRICQEMHRLIRDEAGHTGIAAAMRHVDHGDVELERMSAEERSAARAAASNR